LIKKWVKMPFLSLLTHFISPEGIYKPAQFIRRIDQLLSFKMRFAHFYPYNRLFTNILVGKGVSMLPKAPLGLALKRLFPPVQWRRRWKDAVV